MSTTDLALPAESSVPSTELAIQLAFEEYVARFNQFSKKTAEAIVGMAETAYLAKKALYPLRDGGATWERFCSRLNFDSDPSSLRKLIIIGEMADMLKQHTDQLPSAWTTLYKLSQLGSETLKQFIDDGKVGPNVTLKVATDLFNQHQESSGVPVAKRTPPSAVIENILDDRYSMTIHWANTPKAEDAQAIYKAVAEVLRTNNSDANLSRSRSMVALFTDHVTAMLTTK